MIPALAIRVGTALVFFVGFGAGWWWRGRRDSERAAELFAKLQERNGRK
jgi:hypothetical protein